MKIALHTLGCKVNQYDTNAMASKLMEQGHDILPFEGEADVYILNTCTVTGESDRKARQIIARVHRQHPEALLAVCGCLTQRDAAGVLAMDGVDAVLGTTARLDINRALMRMQKGQKMDFVVEFSPTMRYEESCGALIERTRAHVKIQDGCDRVCTYCIIPKTRGPIRSRSIGGLVSECESAFKAGHYEVVLTGIRLAAYGREQGLTLMDAVEAAAKTHVGRIRLGSLDPDEVDDDFIVRAASCEKLCKHFHLSLQSGSDVVLRRMGRKYTTEAYAEIVAKIRRSMPDASFSTDIMVGFVGESEQDHEQSCRFVEDIGFMRLHVFPYSKREGTAAARMKGHLSKAVKQQRAKEMISIGKELESAYAESQIGQCVEVVWEQVVHGVMEGHARSYLCVRADSIRPKAGQVSQVRIRGVLGQIALA